MRRSRLVLLAGVSLAVWLALRALAPEFRWGEAHQQRPILLFVALMGVQWLLFFAAMWVLRRCPEDWIASRPAVLLAIGLCFHLAMLRTNPIQEHDAYRYLWDGAVLGQGVSPYRYAPEAALKGDAPPLQALIEDDSGARETLRRVAYRDVPTIYPPGALASFWLGHQLGGWSWDGLRFVYIFAYFLGALLLVQAVRSPSFSASIPNAPSASQVALLLGWCPLAVKEIGNSAHVDAALAACFGALVRVVMLRGHTFLHGAAIGAILAVAVLFKLYPLLLVPVFAACLWRRGIASAAAMFVVFAAICCCAYAPFLLGEGDVLAGFRVFTDKWQRNAGLFSVLQFIVTLVFGDAQVSVPYLPGGIGPAGTVAAKIVAQAMVIGVIGWTSWWTQKAETDEQALQRVIRSSMYVLLAWFLLLPMAYPWYLLGVLVFVAVLRPCAVAWTLIASVSTLYYAYFHIEYHDLPKSWDAALRCLEYAAPLLALCCFTLQKKNVASMNQSSMNQ